MKKFYAIMCIFVMMFSVCAYAEGQPVVDECDYLTISEEVSLEERLEEIKDKYSIDVAVVIVESLDGKTAEAYADDYYDYNGYGYGSDDDGMLLLISKNPRRYHITTFEKAVEIFDDRILENMYYEIESDLSNDDYYDACMIFADMVDEAIYNYENGITGKSYDNGDLAKTIMGTIIISLIIAAVLTVKAYKGMNTARVQSNADNYVKNGSFNLTKSNDIFLYSNVTKTKIESKSSSGGRTHRSSSGRRHGGGGGRY